MSPRIVYWFRNDLRLNDNEAFLTATLTAKEVIPVYVFDPRLFQNTKLGFRRTSARRAQFLIESVTDLRNRLRAKGADLLVRIGDPEKIVADLADYYQATHIYTSKEIAPEETHIESTLSKSLKISNIDIKLFWMSTLSRVTDLPFSVSKLPVSFDQFKTEVGQIDVPLPFPEPDKITLPQEYEAGSIATLPTLGIDPQELIHDDVQADELPHGGETAAIASLKSYIESNQPQRNTAVDALTDSLLTSWLSLGNLSPRTLYHTIQKECKAGETKEALLKSLLQRDYFNWTLLRFGPRMFKSSGIQHIFQQAWLNNKEEFENWIKGKTSDSEVNEIMKKIGATGYITSLERQKAAIYLSQHKNINWTWGAMYFESFLIDYNVAVNWGKWNNVAGVGAN